MRPRCSWIPSAPAVLQASKHLTLVLLLLSRLMKPLWGICLHTALLSDPSTSSLCKRLVLSRPPESATIFSPPTLLSNHTNYWWFNNQKPPLVHGATHCFPGSTVFVMLAKTAGIALIRPIRHKMSGSQCSKLRCLAETKQDFNDLLHFLSSSRKYICLQADSYHGCWV